MRVLCLFAAVAGCGGVRGPADGQPPTSKDASVTSAAPRLERIDLGPSHRGLSGLTRDETGALWAVAERARTLARFDDRGGAQKAFTIEGVADDVDLESIAALGASRFAVGTEGRGDGREADAILILKVEGSRAIVTDAIEVPYQRLGFESRNNQGIEGLCATADAFFVAIETPQVVNEKRAARLVRIERTESGAPTWTSFSLALTSDTGKISALACRDHGSHVELLAIERHFEVVRVLHFVVAGDVESGAVIEPSVAADLEGLRRESENPEGITWAGESAALLILDNDFGAERGPTLLQRVGLR